MTTEKYTRKTLEAFRTAQALAQEKGNQYLTPEHLFYALLNQKEGLIGSIFGSMGVDCGALSRETLAVIDRLPRISGGSGFPHAALHVCRQHHAIGPLQHRLGSHDLIGDVPTVAVLLHHLQNTVDLSPGGFQQLRHLGVVGFHCTLTTR